MCKPEIEKGEWQDYDEDNEVMGGYTLIKEKSYMFCTNGCGVLYITDDGQKAKDMGLLAAEILFNRWWNNDYLGGGRIGRDQIENAILLLDKNKRLPDIAPYVSEEQLLSMGYQPSAINLYMIADLNRVLIKYEITTTERMRHFFAQCIKESAICKSLPIEDGDKTCFIANGYWPYYGAGYIQLSGSSHYKCFAIYIAKDVYQDELGEVVYYNSNNSGEDLIQPEYEKFIDIAKEKNLDISEYIKIFDPGVGVEGEGAPEYVAYEFGWETAGYFWDIGGASETVDSFAGSTDEYNVDKITDVVNRHTGSREERRDKYLKVQGIIK